MNNNIFSADKENFISIFSDQIHNILLILIIISIYILYKNIKLNSKIKNENNIEKIFLELNDEIKELSEEILNELDDEFYNKIPLYIALFFDHVKLTDQYAQNNIILSYTRKNFNNIFKDTKNKKIPMYGYTMQQIMISIFRLKVKYKQIYDNNNDIINCLFMWPITKEDMMPYNQVQLFTTASNVNSPIIQDRFKIILIPMLNIRNIKESYKKFRIQTIITIIVNKFILLSYNNMTEINNINENKINIISIIISRFNILFQSKINTQNINTAKYDEKIKSKINKLFHIASFNFEQNNLYNIYIEKYINYFNIIFIILIFIFSNVFYYYYNFLTNYKKNIYLSLIILCIICLIIIKTIQKKIYLINKINNTLSELYIQQKSIF
jgi:hypothetical protein